MNGTEQQDGMRGRRGCREDRRTLVPLKKGKGKPGRRGNFSKNLRGQMGKLGKEKLPGFQKGRNWGL